MNKPKKSIDILVLSDGKPGHLYQSLGITERLTNSTRTVVEAEYKTPFRRKIVYGDCLINRFSWRDLEWALTENTVSFLKEYAPRIVLSTGSAVAPLTYILGRLYPSKTVICMRSAVLNQGKHFDCAILSHHDYSKRIHNAFHILGAPNIITESYLEECGRALLDQVKEGKGTRIGILIGGDSKTAYISEENIRDIISGCSVCAAESPVHVLYTTSRRTPPGIEKILKENLEKAPFTGYSLHAGESAYNPVPGILSLSDILIVTDDSCSMISEAASCGKPVLVVKTERRSVRALKYEKTVEEMEHLGYIKRIFSGETGDALLYLVKKNIFHAPKLDDAGKAAEAVEKLLAGSS